MKIGRISDLYVQYDLSNLEGVRARDTHMHILHVSVMVQLIKDQLECGVWMPHS